MSAFTQDCFSNRMLTLMAEMVKLSITMAGELWRRHEAERGCACIGRRDENPIRSTKVREYGASSGFLKKRPNVCTNIATRVHVKTS